MTIRVPLTHHNLAILINITAILFIMKIAAICILTNTSTKLTIITIINTLLTIILLIIIIRIPITNMNKFLTFLRIFYLLTINMILKYTTWILCIIRISLIRISIIWVSIISTWHAETFISNQSIALSICIRRTTILINFT